METLALIAVVAIHLLAVNLAAAGPIVAVWLEWRAKRWEKLSSPSGTASSDAQSPSSNSVSVENNSAVSQLIWFSFIAAIVGVGLGLISLLLIGNSAVETNAYAEAIKNVTPDRWWFMGGEVVFYFICLPAFLLWPAQRFVWLRRLLPLAAGTNLLYHFPAFFTILAVISVRPELRGAVLDKTLYHHLAWDSEVFARVLHVWMASFAVAGVTLVWVAHRIARYSGNQPSPALTKFGGRIALWSTMLQIPVGIFVLTTLPLAQQTKVMTGDLWCTTLFAAAVIVALALMHQLAMLSLGDVSRRRLNLSAILLSATVFLMTAMLHFSRG